MAEFEWECETALSREQWNVMKTHPSQGARIILEHERFERGRKFSPSMWENIALCCLCHHERWDGKGYPLGLKGEQIPYIARLVSLGDAFDAMMADRPYRKALTFEAAWDELLTGAGSQFDPILTRIFYNAMVRPDKIDQYDSTGDE